MVGSGPGNRQAMTAEVLETISEADCVIGARRMLEAVVDGKKPVCDAIAPGAMSDFIHSQLQYSNFAVAMSGDVGFFSGT